jgi:hypothetical protein
MISINYSFLPLRMVISKKEPVAFTVEIQNRTGIAAMVSLELEVTKELSFGRGSFKRNVLERVDSFEAGGSRKFHYDISAHPLYIEPGEKTISMKANIHHNNNYSYIERSFRKDAQLIVAE